MYSEWSIWKYDQENDHIYINLKVLGLNLI